MRLLHVSDTHFFDADYTEEYIRRVSLMIKQAIINYSIDICLHTGDILNRNMPKNGYETYLKYWPECLHVPGNHDDSKQMQVIFPECASGFPYVKNCNGIRFTGIDTSSGKSR